MENEILIAILSKLVEEKISQLPVIHGPRGLRGHVGRDGVDGRGFLFSEHEETIRGWVREFALKFEDFTSEQIETLRGPRGRDGRDGEDGTAGQPGKSFTFEDLSAEQIEAVRGPRGRDGKNGTDGKDFNLADHEEVWRNLAREFALKFEDFTAEQIEAVRGPRGRDGEDGRNFIFEENKDAIEGIIREFVVGLREELRLKFSDLSADDIEQLRGPRGRDGHDGRDFNFDEHSDFFNSLRPRFADFTEEEKAQLKLRFNDLTPEEKATLKLRFEDLTDEDRTLIRGPRGARGQRGQPGRDGASGPRGPRGLPGHAGVSGLTGPSGKDGLDGQDGADAPYITEIEVEEIKNNVWVFVFYFSDGSIVESNRLDIPVRALVYSGPPGARGPAGADGAAGPQGPAGPAGGTFTTFTFTDGQAATALSGEIFDHTVFNEVDYIARIVRGTTVFARMEFSLFYRNGAWETVISDSRFGGADSGVTPTSDPITGQVYLAADSGAGDGRVTLEKTTLNI